MDSIPQKDSKFRLRDLFIVLICLFVIIISLVFFRVTLIKTINLRNIEPVGTIIEIKNIVQRRNSNSIFWDRLASESAVYLNDFIYVPELSFAKFYLKDNILNLEENTLIHIMSVSDGKSYKISLLEGSLSFVIPDEGTAVTINLNGKQAQIEPGTVVSVSVDEEGFSIKVSKGTVQFIDEEGKREISFGRMIMLDSYGEERRDKSAVVISPIPNEHFLKITQEPVAVDFTWNRIYLQPNELPRLEISTNRNFNQIFNSAENLNRQARVLFDTGEWYWRLLLDDKILSSGRLTVTTRMP